MTAPIGESTRADRRSREGAGSPWLMLAMATLGFAVNFWAWTLISPLGPLFRDQGTLGSLSESDVALLVAVPVIVGSLGRIVVGALTDRYGGRVMFPIVTGVTIVPILFIAFFALDSYALLLVGGFFLGIAGTAFAVGVPFVNAWFPLERRGLAIGIFGAGMGGTAISALTTVRLFNNVGSRAPFLITAAVLAAYAVAAWLILRDAPGRTAPTTSLMTRLSANARLPITWQACALYAVAFGGYVAFSVYLPAYLKTDYALTPADAANRMGGFVLVAVIMRPVGGWLSDRIGPIPVLAVGHVRGRSPVALPPRQVRVDHPLRPALREPVVAHRQPALPLRDARGRRWPRHRSAGAAVVDRRVGISEHAYHVVAVAGGLLAGVMTVVGMAILIYRRRTVGPVFSATTRMDKVMYFFLAVVIVLGMWNTIAGSILTIGGEYNYREGVSVWYRSFLAFHPDAALMADAPLGFQLHALVAFALFALWPFTRLVHVFSAPLGYLTRPYIVYRSRDDVQLGSHSARRGWDRVG